MGIDSCSQIVFKANGIIAQELEAFLVRSDDFT